MKPTRNQKNVSCKKKRGRSRPRVRCAGPSTLPQRRPPTKGFLCASSRRPRPSMNLTCSVALSSSKRPTRLGERHLFAFCSTARTDKLIEDRSVMPVHAFVPQLNIIPIFDHNGEIIDPRRGREESGKRFFPPVRGGRVGAPALGLTPWQCLGLPANRKIPLSRCLCQVVSVLPSVMVRWI